MKLVTGEPLVWHVGELPKLKECVIAITETDVGEAWHDDDCWYWQDGHKIASDVIAWADMPAPVNVCGLIEMALNPVSQKHVQDWISAMLANRMVVKPVEETVYKTARIRGISSIVVQGVTDSEIDVAMRQQLEGFALRQINAGLPLPDFGDVPEVKPEVAACIVQSRLRALLKARSKEWAASRTNLPPHILLAIIADFDLLISRHAATIQSA